MQRRTAAGYGDVRRRSVPVQSAKKRQARKAGAFIEAESRLMVALNARFGPIKVLNSHRLRRRFKRQIGSAPCAHEYARYASSYGSQPRRSTTRRCRSMPAKRNVVSAGCR